MHRRTRCRLRPLWKTPKRPPLTGCSPYRGKRFPCLHAPPIYRKGERSPSVSLWATARAISSSMARVICEDGQRTDDHLHVKRESAGALSANGSSRTETPPILVTHEMISIPNSASSSRAIPDAATRMISSLSLNLRPQNRAIGNVVLQRSPGRPCRGERENPPKAYSAIRFQGDERHCSQQEQWALPSYDHLPRPIERSRDLRNLEFWPSPDKASHTKTTAPIGVDGPPLMRRPAGTPLTTALSSALSILQLFRSASCSPTCVCF